MKSVEVRYGWLLLTASVIAVVLLRHNKWALIGYTGAVVVGVVAFLIAGPRLAARAEQRFTRDALTRLHAGDEAGIIALVQQQWWLKHFGRQHLLADTLGLAALGAGRAEAACTHLAEAVRLAPPDAQPRLTVHLAQAERAAGRPAEAEGRLRALIGRHTRVPGAQAELGQLLLAHGDPAEAAALLRAALAQGGQRQNAPLQLALARALLASGQPGVEAALAAASAAGAEPGEVSKLAARAKSHATTVG